MMKRSPNFYKKLIAFFRDWNYAKIVAFYKAELSCTDEEYLKLEKRYFGKQITKEKLYDNLFIKDNIEVLSIILKNSNIVEQWKCLRKEDFYDWLEDNIGEEYHDLLEALSRGYLIEWLFFCQGDNILFLLNSTPKYYADWLEYFEGCDFTRVQVQYMPKIGLEHQRCILYRSIVNENMLHIMFDGMNGGHLYKHNGRILSLLVKHDLLQDIREVYDEEMRFYGRRNNWDPNLFKYSDSVVEEIELPAVDKKLMSFLDHHVKDTVYTNSSRKDRIPVTIDKVKFVQIIYRCWEGYEYDINNRITRVIWHSLYKYLCDEKKIIFKLNREPYKPFADNIIHYVFSDVDASKYKDVLREKIAKNLNEEEMTIVNNMMLKFKYQINEYIHSLITEK